MEERQVTVDGVARAVPRPFVVIATQNPIEMEGTYNLPEAQLDRFLLKMSMGYPDLAAEAEIVLSRHGGPPPVLDPVMDRDEVTPAWSRSAPRCASTRSSCSTRSASSRPHGTSGDLRLGASPRGSLGLLRAAQSLAAAEGRRLRHRRRREAARRARSWPTGCSSPPTPSCGASRPSASITDLLGTVGVPGGVGRLMAAAQARETSESLIAASPGPESASSPGRSLVVALGIALGLSPLVGLRRRRARRRAPGASCFVARAAQSIESSAARNPPRSSGVGRRS